MADAIAATETINPNAIAAEAARRNFAKSYEAKAHDGTPGFETYLAKDAPILPLKGPNANVTANQMSYEDDDLSFSDVVDFLNPLQHLPIVGTIYREITGDTDIKPYVQTAGDILYGGIIGTVGSMVLGVLAGPSVAATNTAVGQETGENADKHVASAIWGSSSPTTAPIQVANTDIPPIAPTAAQAAAQTPAQAATTKPAKTTGTSQFADANLPARIQDAIKKANEQTSVKPGDRADKVNQLAAQIARRENNIQIGKNTYTKPLSKTHTTQTARPETITAASAQTAANDATETSEQTKTAASPAAIATTATETRPTQLTAQTQAQTQAQAQAQAQPSTQTPAQAAKSYDNTQFGSLVHDSAQKAQRADNIGKKNALPPELIQDMMMMALDKYQAANTVGAPAEPTSTLQ